MMDMYAIEAMAYHMVEQYAADAPSRYKERVVNVMYNTVRMSGVRDSVTAEDMMRGICHVFCYGAEWGGR